MFFRGGRCVIVEVINDNRGAVCREGDVEFEEEGGNGCRGSRGGGEGKQHVAARIGVRKKGLGRQGGPIAWIALAHGATKVVQAPTFRLGRRENQVLIRQLTMPEQRQVLVLWALKGKREVSRCSDTPVSTPSSIHHRGGLTLKVLPELCVVPPLSLILHDHEYPIAHSAFRAHRAPQTTSEEEA